MASQEIGNAYNWMNRDMIGKLETYKVSLQMRFGDPRVYAMEEQRMAAQRAAVAHANATTRSEALRTSYEKSREDVRTAHSTRMREYTPSNTQ